MTVTAETSSDDVFGAVVGQTDAVERLVAASQNPVHAYLFLGPTGAGTPAAARAFAALLLAQDQTDPEVITRVHQAALTGEHPDLVEVAVEGSALRVVEAESIIRTASTSPSSAKRKVIVVPRVDVIEENAIGKLLKIIEEPPATCVFIVLAEEVPPEIATIASRCVTVEFSPLSTSVIETTLFLDGIKPGRAKAAAAAAGGDLERARLLATDDELAQRAELWAAAPGRLDGSGSAVFQLVSELREAMDRAAAPLQAKHEQELADLDARAEMTGERGSGRSALVTRQKRELRKLRNDELRFGLATLSRRFRDELVESNSSGASDAIRTLQTAAEDLIRNPNEPLFLQGLFLRLSAP